jgi:hypothetical protein
LFLNLAVQYAIRKDWNWMEDISSWSMLMLIHCVKT